ncbi:MAG: CPBP family intramembrane metalloprotease [Oscillospiraceae bacterium]|nr:CPBP family intramembrane metalloprotease [Oscillospiraceae bacterium]
MKTDVQERPAETGEDKLRWRYQDKAYNEIYKQWRKKNQDTVGFYFAENSSKVTYQEGVGLIKDLPETHEKHALEKVLSLVGKCMLFCVLCDVFSTYFLPGILNRMGFDIQYDFFMNKLYGNTYLVMTVDFIKIFLPRLIISIIFIMSIKLPFQVILPMKITNKHMFRVCVPAMLLTSGVCCLMSMVSASLLPAYHMKPEYFVTMPQNVPQTIFLIVTQVIIISIVREFFCRGMMLQLIRQFGDELALIITSFVMASACYDVSRFFYAFIGGMVIGYFTIRTGSVLTAILMKFTYLGYTYAVSLIHYKIDPLYGDIVLLAFLFVTIVTGLIFVVRFLYLHSDCFGVTMKNRYMSLRQKLLLGLTNIPVIMWLTTTVIVTVLSISFTPRMLQ